MLAVMDDAGFLDGGAKPALVAHSFGAHSAAVLAAHHGEKLARMVMVDTGMAQDKGPSSSTKPRRYKTLREALGRFRLSPPQECQNTWLVDEVARHGLVQDTDSSWRWCFDPDYVQKLRYFNSFDVLDQSRCPLTFVYGEQSVLTPSCIRRAQQAQAPAGTTFTAIPDAGSSRDAGSAEAPGYNLAPAPDDVLTWAVPDPAPPNSLDLAARLPTGVDRKCRLDQGRGVAASCGVAVSSFNVELQE